MPLIDSRLGPGTLKFGTTTDVSYQASSVRLVPDVNETDGTPTLAVPQPAPDAKVTWTLQGTVIQDFTDAASFVNWCSDNALSEETFEFVPVTAATPLKYAGTVKVYPVEIGGDAGVQVTTDFSMPIVGAITRTDPTGTTTLIGDPVAELVE
jgi:hypothetical protein